MYDSFEYVCEWTNGHTKTQIQIHTHTRFVACQSVKICCFTYYLFFLHLSWFSFSRSLQLSLSLVRSLADSLYSLASWFLPQFVENLLLFHPQAHIVRHKFIKKAIYWRSSHRRIHTHTHITANPKTAISPNRSVYRNIHSKHFIFIQMKLTISAR